MPITKIANNQQDLLTQEDQAQLISAEQARMEQKGEVDVDY